MNHDFLEAYTTYASGNEACPLFHLWAGISTLSAVVSRKVFVDQEYFKIYPNIYVVFVGEPGDKKTTAMVLSRAMVQKIGMAIAPPSATLQSITQLMGADNEKSPCRFNFLEGTLPKTVTHLSFFASEIVTMLAAGGNPQGLIEFFTDIYDREAYEVLTKNKGNDIIDAPYITILACMTPEQTGQLLKERLITGGFSRRCIFVYGRSRANPISRPHLTQQQKDAKIFCLHHLEKVKAYKGEYKFTPDGMEFFDAWYAKKHRQLAMPHTAPFKNWLRSKDAMLLKVGMLLDLAGPMTGMLDQKTLEHGVRMLDETEKDLNRVFAGAGKNPLAELAFKIVSRLEEAPDKRLSKKKLIASLFEDGNIEDLDKAIDFLVRTDQVGRLVSSTTPPVEVLVIRTLTADSPSD